MHVGHIIIRCLQRFSAAREGVSIAEMVVTLAILTIISMMVLANFSGIGSAAALDRSAREMANTLRAAQINAISVRKIIKFDEVPPAIGVHFDPSLDPRSYSTFADLSASYDWKFQPAELMDTFFTDQKTRINRLLVNDIPLPAGTRTNIIFVSPEATMYIVDDVTTPADVLGDLLEIELEGISGRTKSVIVRTTGQISVR